MPATAIAPSGVRDKAARHKLRAALLSLCASPKPSHVQCLHPNESGEFPFVSRQEAIDRKLPVYTGKVSTLDKPFRLIGGGWCAIRFTANGNTAGQLRLQKIVSKESSL